MHKSNHRGTWDLDRVFGSGIGRLKRKSGTYDPATYRMMDAMLTALYRAPRHDLLLAIKDKRLKPLEVFEAYRLHRLDALPSADMLQGLAPALTAWLAHPPTPVGLHSKQSRGRAVTRILALARADATLKDLPGLLRKLETGPAMFNHVRAHLMACCRDIVGRRHAVYQAIQDIPHRQEAKTPGARLTVAEVAQLAEQMAPYGGEVWSLVITGMRTKAEYFDQQWEVLVGADHITIAGAKGRGGHRPVRMVPRIPGYEVQAPTVSYRHFGWLMRGATGGHVTPYNLRGTYAVWLEQCGVSPSRVRAYLGHGRRTVTDLYTHHEVVLYLEADGARLAAFLGGGHPTSNLRLA